MSAQLEVPLPLKPRLQVQVFEPKVLLQELPVPGVSSRQGLPEVHSLTSAQVSERVPLFWSVKPEPQVQL